MTKFDWEGIDEKYQWVAQDKHGSVYVFKSEPTVRIAIGMTALVRGVS